MNQNSTMDYLKLYGQNYDHFTSRPDWSAVITTLISNFVEPWKTNCLGLATTHFADEKYTDKPFIRTRMGLEDTINGLLHGRVLHNLTRNQFDVYFALAREERPEGHDIYLTRELGCYLYLIEHTDQGKRAMLFIKGPWFKEDLIKRLLTINDILESKKEAYDLRFSQNYDHSFASNSIPYKDITKEDQAKLEIWEFILDLKKEDELNHNERVVFAQVKAELLKRKLESDKLPKLRWYERL